VAGLDLLAYRFVGNADDMLPKVVAAVPVPVIAAGSIATFERMARVWKAGTWGFTIGSAFFEKKFVPEGSFQENMMKVWNWLEETRETDLDQYLLPVQV
jgi:phosphoribosylformimino-5-aminoimidazole carboxamide ribonucleotide (ProFAR) isomerase